MLDRDARSDTP
jgi:threonine synthase